MDQFQHLKVGLAGILTSIIASFSYARRHPHTAAPLHAEEERREVAAHRGQASEET